MKCMKAFLMLTVSVILFAGCKATPEKIGDDGTVSVELVQLTDSKPAMHGMGKLEQALLAKELQVSRTTKPSKNSDVYIIAGLADDDNLATKLLKKQKLELPEGKESLRIQRTEYKGKPALVLCGGDDVGLMYAALDTAKRISWSEDDLFEHVLDVAEKADVQERTVSIGSFNRTYFEGRLHDSDYWAAYFDMMAENRLNQFLLIFGYKNNQYHEPNYTAPMYPNFFDVSEFPNIKMSNITPEMQQKNCESLQVMIDLAHERGIEFGVGLWDQIERSKQLLKLADGEGEIPADFRANLTWGLNKQNLIPYTEIAMRRFFRMFPEIDLVQFRMHWESGIEGETALKFWKEIFSMIKEECPDIKIEARAKDVPDETLYDGVDTGADFRVATKHWMEQMGMPFHPTHVNKQNQHDRRHGYADLLRYPKRYGFKWRVWSGGTTRVFIWGDPEWVKVFAEGSHLYDSVGYEFNEPLYFKMNGSMHNAPTTTLLNPDNEYYTYEFERYWHYYQVMGRVGYNPETPSDIWEMEFKDRFGEEAGPLMMAAVHRASKVLPRIVSASYLYPRFASPQGWPELQRLESLQHFAKNSKPSDIQQFASPIEEAKQVMAGEFDVRRGPMQISEWFRETSGLILTDVSKAEEAVGDNPSKEFISTATDLKMLAHLAMYHANRLQSAVQYNYYTHTGDLVSFNNAMMFETQAVASYGRMAAAAGDVYNRKLDFGWNKNLFPGHWKDEHEVLKRELQAVIKDKGTVKPAAPIIHIPVQRLQEKQSIWISATVLPEIKEVKLHYANNDGVFKSVATREIGEGIVSARIPGSKAGTVKYYLSGKDAGGKTVSFHSKDDPCVILVSNDREPPVAELDRIATAPLNQSLKVTAKVDDASELEFVNLRYRRVSQFEDYEIAKMVLNETSGRYEAEIPAAMFDGKYDVMYFVEAMDVQGNGRMYPDLEVETPYVMVKLER